MSVYIGKLGKQQAAIYKALLDHHSWYRGCGWIWSTNGATERLLESLVRRGYVRKETYSYEGVLGQQRIKTRYLPAS